MPKSLSRWNNRETFLYVGNESYSGRVERTLINRTVAEGRKHDTYLYLFKADNGPTFVISEGTVRACHHGLEVKNFRNFVPYFPEKTGVEKTA